MIRNRLWHYKYRYSYLTFKLARHSKIYLDKRRERDHKAYLWIPKGLKTSLLVSQAAGLKTARDF